jgi:hypothetical protein
VRIAGCEGFTWIAEVKPSLLRVSNLGPRASEGFTTVDGSETLTKSRVYSKKSSIKEDHENCR